MTTSAKTPANYLNNQTERRSTSTITLSLRQMIPKRLRANFTSVDNPVKPVDDAEKRTKFGGQSISWQDELVMKKSLDGLMPLELDRRTTAMSSSVMLDLTSPIDVGSSCSQSGACTPMTTFDGMPVSRLNINIGL